ncbi:MAG: sodium-dependent transporter, partial [Cyclobacteriaceae bacterium]|nr:sodium-dependent transporter [Cyclobacteriaceae bacterium]
KKQFIDADSDFKVSKYYFGIFIYLNIFLGLFLIYWWMSQGYSENPWFSPEGNWNMFDIYSNASVITQWAIILVSGILLNKWIYTKFGKS